MDIPPFRELGEPSLTCDQYERQLGIDAQVLSEVEGMAECEFTALTLSAHLADHAWGEWRAGRLASEFIPIGVPAWIEDHL